MTGGIRTHVDWFTASRLKPDSATATLGAWGANRTLMAGFSDQCYDHVSDPGETLVKDWRFYSSFLVAGQVCYTLTLIPHD